MNIAFDASDLCAGHADGTTRYTRELAARLPKLASEHTWNMMLQCSPPKAPTLADNASWASSPWPKYWTQSRMPAELYKTKPDLLFMPIQQLPAIRPRKMKTIAVIHDLAYHYFPEQFTYKNWLLLTIFGAQAINEADHLIAVSQATADDIKKIYGRTQNVHVVHHGVDHEVFHPPTNSQTSWNVLQAEYPSLKKPYILYVGQIQPRKNLIRLIEVFELLKKDAPELQLVIGGSHGWLRQPIEERVKASPHAKDILMLGRVPDALLPSLYAHAEVFTLVSLYEGFGIPVIEAMACGAPVVTSNTSSMPEVAGDAAVLVDPQSVQSIADGIQKARNMRDELSLKGIAQAKQFTWDTTAQKTFDIVTKCLS
ncbi:MAG: glycosyltransferase family 1 protein [Candidatus Andersenbacteria bacterium]